MTYSSSEQYRSNSTNKRQWSARNWFALLVGLLLLCTLVYVFTHGNSGKQGYEYTRFTTADIRHVNSILAYDLPVTNTNSIGVKKQQVSNNNDGFLDSYPEEDEPNTYLSEFPVNNNFSNLSERESLKLRAQKVLIYIKSQYGAVLDEDQMSTIEEYIMTFNARELGIFLADYKLKVQSYFWLTGRMVYAEVIFWVLVGVLCSLLFSVGKQVRRGKDSFNHRDIIYQVARLFYAPFAAILLVLAYSYLKNNTTLNIEANESILIIAFLVGLYSGVIMELFDRLKNMMLNINQPNDEREVVIERPAMQPLQQNQNVSKAQEPEQPISPVNNATVAEVYATDAAVNEEPITEEEDYTKNDQPQNSEIREVDIDLKLDYSGLFDEEKTQLQRLGFSKAIVTLHNVNGKDIIPASKLNDDMTTFVANNVRPGIYIARATLSQRLKDDQIINLFGEKTAYVTEDKPGLELYVKKYEAID